MKSNILIDINKLRFAYGNNNRSFELKVDDLQVYKNKITTIIGRSGYGKSSLLDIIGLIRKPNNFSQTKICYHFNEGFEINKLWKNNAELQSLKRKSFGYIFQQPFFLEDISVFKNAELNLIVSGFPSDKRMNYFNEHFIESGLFEESEKKVFREKMNSEEKLLSSLVSGGQRQRFSILRATIPGSDLLLADEPTGNLDPINSEKVFKFLRNWVDNDSKQNNTLVMVTHDIDSALVYSDSLIIIDSENEIKKENRFYKENGKWFLINSKEEVEITKEFILSILKKVGE